MENLTDSEIINLVLQDPSSTRSYNNPDRSSPYVTMNIAKVSLFNFDGVEGLVEASLEPRLSRILQHFTHGIRFLLDRTYNYRNATGLAGQYVQLTIKYQDEELQLTRHVDNPDFILMDQRQVPVRMYFWDLGETLARIDADWLVDVVAFSNKHWMDILTRSTVQQGLNEAPLNIECHEHVGLEKWRSFKSRRIDRVERVVERNDLIKRCRSIGKCRNKLLKKSIGDVEHSLSRITGQWSRNCNAIQAQTHSLVLDIIADQTKVFASLQSVTELYHDMDMDVAEEFSQLYQAIQNEAHQVSSSISAVNSSQRTDYQAVILGSEGSAQETKAFQLQFTAGCLELARMPMDVQRSALEEDRLRLNERYSTWHMDYRAGKERVDEQLHRHEQYVLDLDAAAEQLDADLSDWLAAMEQVNRKNKALLKESNRRAVDKISLRVQLEEIRTVLTSSTADYDEASLHGLSSVLRLLELDEYAAAKQSELLGPIFESVRFKEDTDIVLQTYFRARLHSWYSVIVVRSVAFAHRLTMDFNARKLRGTISIMACDNYRQPADAPMGSSKGVTLADVLDIAEDHPLLHLFSSLVYEETTNCPEDLSDVMRDPVTGGLTLSTIDYPVAGIQYEKLLQQYYRVDQELIALEQYPVPVEEIERSVRAQVQVMDARLCDLAGLVRSGAQIIQGQRAVQTEMLYLGRIRDTLTRIDLRQRINKKLIDLLARGELELSPSTYAAQIEVMLRTPIVPSTAPSGDLVALCDPSNTDGQLEYLQFVMDFNVQPSSFWPVLPSVIVRETCCYVDRELPVEERVTELSAEHQSHLGTLNEYYRRVLRWKRTQRMYEEAGMDIHVDPSRTLSTREHHGKPLAELDGELRRMGCEYNVRARSRVYPKRVISCAKRIRDTQQGVDTDAIQQSLRNYMACEKSEPQLDLLNKLWPHVKHFYAEVRPDGLSEVELVWQAMSGGEVGRYLSFKDMDGVEVILRSVTEGQFSIRELGHRAQQVFGIAVLYAKLKINDIRVVSVSKDVETALGSETLRGILNLFSTNDFQILLH